MYDAYVEVIRVALKESHVRDLPSFEAGTKAKDPRYEWFVKNYGRTCWELDAMDPRQLREEVDANIRVRMDLEYWAWCKRVEEAERESLVEVMQIGAQRKVGELGRQLGKTGPKGRQTEAVVLVRITAKMMA